MPTMHQVLFWFLKKHPQSIQDPALMECIVERGIEISKQLL